MTTHIFEIAADPNAPGSYTHVDGYTLVYEGCAMLNPGESFADTAASLRSCYGADARFALVEVDEDDAAYSVLEAEA